GADGRREIPAGDLRALQTGEVHSHGRHRYEKHRSIPGSAAGRGMRRKLDGQTRMVRDWRFRQGPSIGWRGCVSWSRTAKELTGISYLLNSKNVHSEGKREYGTNGKGRNKRK